MNMISFLTGILLGALFGISIYILLMEDSQAPTHTPKLLTIQHTFH